LEDIDKIRNLKLNLTLQKEIPSRFREQNSGRQCYNKFL
jgi:hypothetical protein